MLQLPGRLPHWGRRLLTIPLMISVALLATSAHGVKGCQAGRAFRGSHVPSGTIHCRGLEKLWYLAGGNPGDEQTAASIAMAESSGQQYATGKAGERGYWQINPDHGSLSTYDALGNARAAVKISGDGSNWSPWTTFTSGAYAGRC